MTTVYKSGSDNPDTEVIEAESNNDDHKVESKPSRKDSLSDIEKLNATVKSANRILFKTQAIFPFDFFPDEVIIDENKVDIISSKFFTSRETFTIPIENINGVTNSLSLFFGELRIEAWGINRLPGPIKYLSRLDAIKARRIISGLILSHKEQIDMRNIPLEELKRKLEEIGRAHERTI